MPPQILIVDDHPLYLAGLQVALSPAFRLQPAESLGDALAVLGRAPGIDLVLVDLHLRDASGTEGLRVLGQSHPNLPRVAMSGLDDTGLPQLCRQAGASGFLPKAMGACAMRQALECVLAGEVWFPCDAATTPAGRLSPRENEVLARLATGQTNKEIARALDITERTVKAHVRAIFDALGARTRTEAVRLALACQWLTL
jgi:DNA-binding NarL/FixJ family response regulator